MGIRHNIKNSRDSLSSTDLKLANFVLENMEEIPTMTSNALAEASETSPATVVRFSRKMGFQKFSEFKLAISKDVEKQIYNEYSQITFKDSFQISKSKLVHNNKMIIGEMEELLDEKVALRAVVAIQQATKIYVYGAGSSALAAEDIRQKWNKLGKTVIFDKDIYMVLQQMNYHAETSLFWGISHSGKNRNVLTLLEQAKDNGIITIGISQLGKNKLASEADITIQTARTDEINNGHYGSGATHSILLQLITIDALYYFYIKYLQLKSL